MKIVFQNPQTLVLRFDKGDDVIAGLSEYCKKRNLFGFFTGLGASGEVTLSYYDLEKKEYLDKTITQDLEIASLTGNLAKIGEKWIVHAHGVFSDAKLVPVAGHVKKLIVSATCEIHLTILNTPIERSYDTVTGLNLLKS